MAEQAPCLQQELCVLDATIKWHQSTPYYHGNYVIYTLQNLLPRAHDIHLQWGKKGKTAGWRGLLFSGYKRRPEISASPAQSLPVALWCPWHCSWPWFWGDVQSVERAVSPGWSFHLLWGRPVWSSSPSPHTSSGTPEALSTGVWWTAVCLEPHWLHHCDAAQSSPPATANDWRVICKLWFEIK